MSNVAKVFIVNHDNQADYKVYFVDQDYKEKNTVLITPGILVDHDNQADIKVFIVNHDNQADILITRKHFPKKGWLFKNIIDNFERSQK